MNDAFLVSPIEYIFTMCSTVKLERISQCRFIFCFKRNHLQSFTLDKQGKKFAYQLLR